MWHCCRVFQLVKIKTTNSGGEQKILLSVSLTIFIFLLSSAVFAVALGTPLKTCFGFEFPDITFGANQKV